MQLVPQKIHIFFINSGFLSKKDVTEVVIPAFEGEMGILKDHISIISFLKPGIIKINSGNEESSFYVDDGIVEFKNNCLSILTSNIFNIKKMDKNIVRDALAKAEQETKKNDISDQNKYLIDQKIEVLKNLTLN